MGRQGPRGVKAWRAAGNATQPVRRPHTNVDESAAKKERKTLQLS